MMKKIMDNKFNKHTWIKRVLIFLTTVTAIAFHSVSVSSEINTDHFYGGEVTEQRKEALNNSVINSPKQPGIDHPRLYGTNAQWYQTIQRYEALDPNCDWKGSTGQGTIKNIKNSWDRFSLGGETCKSGSHGLPSSLSDHSLAQSYIDNSITQWKRDDALKIVHLIRRMNYCHEIESNCLYSKIEITELSSAFLSYEFSRLRSAPRNSSGYFSAWHKGYQGKFFDLGSYPAFKLWTLILDTFWDSPLLNNDDKQFVLGELEKEIDSFIEIYNLPEDSSSVQGRWAIYNGNNWTTILNAAATFWAVTLWHEEPYVEKTRQVLDIVLKSSWFHRDYILNDGAYTEGPGYLIVAMNGSLEVNNLLMGSFGQPNHAVKWALMGEKTADWMNENIASDGKFVDFGDVWAKDGYANLYIMDMLYWEELVGLKPYGSVQADACDLEDYFANTYYLQAFYDTWTASSHYARDFYSLTSQCQRTQAAANSLIYPDYQFGTLRTLLPGATQTATEVTDDNIRNRLADQTFLAANAVDNSLPHREVDFGGLIWSAYGSRLLSDWGYGQLSNSYQFFDVGGANGHYIASNDHTLEFSLKHISGTVSLSHLFINLKLKGTTAEVPLSNYISELGADWATVSIPMSDFSVNDESWLGNGQGIEYIRLKQTGFVKNGEFGLDEIRVLDPQGNVGITWYGDTHGESLESSTFTTTPQISHPDRLSISKIEQSGGANDTLKWVRFASTGSYVVTEIFYNDDPAELSVSNYMDYLPIGANTLIIPKAQDETASKPEATHTSQFKDQVGQIHMLDVEGREAIHMNAGIVYGKNLAEGNLDYFHRYVIPLSDGNYVVVDSFKAKAGKEDHIQEFWYSYKNITDSCYNRAHDVLQAIDTEGSLLLTPRCNNLLRNEAVESHGRIKAASLEPGAFVLGAPEFMSNNIYFNRFIEGNGLYMMNRLNKKDQRRLARYVSNNEVSEDVRVFLLQSSTSAQHANASVIKSECGDSACFNVSIDGGDTISLQLDKVDNQYVLPGTDLSEPEGEVIIEPEVNGTLLTPVNFSASHPNRTGEPEKLFDEQVDLILRPKDGESLPELRATRPYVNLSSAVSILPNRLAVETESPYGRSIYVDADGAPLSASFTIELDALSTINEVMYYDMSSTFRAGQLIVSVSTNNENWTVVHDDMTGEYKKWVSIAVDNVDTRYVKFEFPEENSAKGITEVLIYGDKVIWGEEQLVQPSSIVSPYPERFKDFSQLFDEQAELTEKPLHLAKIPEYRLSKPHVYFSDLPVLPIRKAIATSSPYGRHTYVDENGNPMLGTVIISLSELHQLTEILYYDMSSSYRPGRLEISLSDDKQNWTSFYDEFTGEYKKWISIPLEGISAQYIKLDFHEENAAKAMTEMLIYGRPAL